MSGVKACIGIWVQNAWDWYPPVQGGSETLPSHLLALAALGKYTPPQPVNAISKDAQPIDVAGDSMVSARVRMVDAPSVLHELAGSWLRSFCLAVKDRRKLKERAQLPLTGAKRTACRLGWLLHHGGLKLCSEISAAASPPIRAF